jgi:hypothetical protein
MPPQLRLINKTLLDNERLKLKNLHQYFGIDSSDLAAIVEVTSSVMLST